jgi:hypothetical protein
MGIRYRALAGGCLVAAVAALAGCGAKPKLVPVTGKVVHKGQPLTAGSIWFQPADGNPYQGEKPSCQLGIDGTFTMRTYPFGNGVPPGAYKVTLSPELARRIQLPAYADRDRTPLRLEVPDQGVKDVVFEIK